MQPLLHLLFRIGLGAAAIGLIGIGVDTIRRTREMQRSRNVRNLLGLRPWYNYFISDERVREKVIISHNYIAAASAILAGIGAALILLHDLTGPNAGSQTPVILVNVVARYSISSAFLQRAACHFVGLLAH
jgi:hypothetical protein